MITRSFAASWRTSKLGPFEGPGALTSSREVAGRGREGGQGKASSSSGGGLAGPGGRDMCSSLPSVAVYIILSWFRNQPHLPGSLDHSDLLKVTHWTTGKHLKDSEPNGCLGIVFLGVQA